MEDEFEISQGRIIQRSSFLSRKQVLLKMPPTMPSTPSVFTKPPSDQPTEKKPAQLTEEQLNRFFHDGYLILHDIGELKT